MGADAEIVRRLANEVFIGGSFATFDELMADDLVDHDPVPGMPPNKEGQRHVAEMVMGAFSDRKAEVDEYIDTADGRVVESRLFSAKHSGEFMGLPARARPYAFAALRFGAAPAERSSSAGAPLT